MNDDVRDLIMTPEFETYYDGLSVKIKEKFDYVLQILKSQRVVSTKFVKSLEKTEFYELRVSVGNNEHRSILFTVDSHSFMESKQVLLLNSFIKKSTKQYKAEIQKA